MAADVSRDDLDGPFAGADVVVHLAWLIQPSHRLDVLEATNVAGSKRVFEAAARSGARALVYASSVGAYSPGPKDSAGRRELAHRRRWARASTPATRRPPSACSTASRPSTRRSGSCACAPALIFKREAASGIRRLFLGRLVPPQLLRPSLIPVVPRTDRLVFQAVHTDDVAEAYRLVMVGDARGAFNIAADPVLDPDELGRILGARPVPVPAQLLLRVAADLSWRAHLQPTPPGWVDLAVDVADHGHHPGPPGAGLAADADLGPGAVRAARGLRRPGVRPHPAAGPRRLAGAGRHGRDAPGACVLSYGSSRRMGSTQVSGSDGSRAMSAPNGSTWSARDRGDREEAPARRGPQLHDELLARLARWRRSGRRSG